MKQILKITAVLIIAALSLTACVSSRHYRFDSHHPSHVRASYHVCSVCGRHRVAKRGFVCKQCHKARSHRHHDRHYR